MKNSLPYKIITQVICVVLLVILVFPLYLMLEKSLAVSGFGNYAKVFEYFNLIPNVITSIIVVGGTLIVVSIVVSMAAYAFSKLEFPHKQAVYYLILTGMMIPTSALDVYKRQVFACMNRMIFIIGSTREMCWSPMVNWEL